MNLDAWTEFFLAAAGAAAALAGLVVVAVSVNVARIVQYRQLPLRAGAAVASLLLALVVSLVCLADQPRVALASEVITMSVITWLIQVHAARVSVQTDREHNRPRYEAVFETMRGQLQSLPFIAGGILVAIGSGAAVYLLLAGILAAFILSMFEAWVLLIEILR